VPIVQVVDYATYPFEELAGPIVPQASRQERVKLTRCILDCEYLISTESSPAELFFLTHAWYLAKFSLQEVINAGSSLAATQAGGAFRGVEVVGLDVGERVMPRRAPPGAWPAMASRSSTPRSLSDGSPTIRDA